MSDSSHKTVLQELEEARASVSRLAAHHARAVGLDARLMAVMREKDDLQQERDSEAQRAKLAESRIAALKERTCKSNHYALVANFFCIFTSQPNCKAKSGASNMIWSNDDNIVWSYLKRYYMMRDLVSRLSRIM